MTTSTLITHCGAREVTREDLDKVEAPPATQTWFPVKHATVIDTVSQALTAAGFQIRGAKYALSRNDTRLFSTVDLATSLAGGVTLGRRCWVGIGACIIEGIKIADDVVIGAGAAVVEDITEPGVYVGVPARRIKP